MEITEVTPVNPLTIENNIKIKEEVPLNKIEVPDSLVEYVNEDAKIGFIEMAIFKISFYKNLIVSLYTLIEGKEMNGVGKTITGLVGIGITLAGHFGFNMPGEVSASILTLTGFIIGLFTKTPVKDKSIEEKI